MPAPSSIPLVQLRLEQWSAHDVDAAFEKRPLLLQVQRAVPPSAGDRRIILFVHGLNSQPATWRTFLEQAFGAPELQPYDFGLFAYQTGLVSRLNPFQRLPRPEDWARVLANVIQSTIVKQERYDSFVLVAHSMGGLISKFAIRYLLESDASAASRLNALFTYGTPNHGSDRAGAIGSLLSPDLAFLRTFGSSVTDLQTFWNSRVSHVIGASGKFVAPERAVVSAKDYWVAPSSGISGLPERMVLRIASSHTELIRPVERNDPRLRWFIDELQSIRRQTECSLLEIRDGPTPEAFQGEDAGGKLAEAIFDAVFVLDVGSVDAVEKNDEFGLAYEPTIVRGPAGEVLDRIPGTMNILHAIEVHERVSYCKLSELAYAPALARLSSAAEELEGQGIEEIDDDQVEKLILSMFGRRAVRIPRAESQAARILKSAYNHILEEDEDGASRDKAFLTLLQENRAFLEKYPTSILADKAAFQVAWATLELRRYEEAEQLFEQFIERYPFSVSIEGARTWLEEIHLRIQLQQSKNGPDEKLELADYLIKGETRIEEAWRLAFEAYSEKPALLAQMNAGLRFMLAAEYVFHQILGMDLAAPNVIDEALKRYASDAAYREEVLSQISLKRTAEQIKLLVDLLGSASSTGTDTGDSGAN